MKRHLRTAAGAVVSLVGLAWVAGYIGLGYLTKDDEVAR